MAKLYRELKLVTCTQASKAKKAKADSDADTDSEDSFDAKPKVLHESTTCHSISLFMTCMT